MFEILAQGNQEVVDQRVGDEREQRRENAQDQDAIFSEFGHNDGPEEPYQRGELDAPIAETIALDRAREVNASKPNDFLSRSGAANERAAHLKET
jgi:hypothetical protein